MQTYTDIEPLFKRLGTAYSKARSKNIAFEKNTKAIFESICKSIVNEEVNLPADGLDKDFNIFDIETDGRKIIDLTKSLGVSMIGIHFRSPAIMIDGGRIYNASSINENNDIENFHDNLLKLYFNLFGRINTFNERIFENFILSSDKKPSIFKVKFNSTKENTLLEFAGISHTVNICPELANSLVPQSLIHAILTPTISIQHFGWYQFIKAQGIKSQLDILVENEWHKILSDNSSIEKWQGLLYFLDSASSPTTAAIWNPITKAHLRKALKFIQGISIYRHFAPSEIVSILSAINNKRDIFGVTIGFNHKETKTEDFITAVVNKVEEFGENIMPQIEVASMDNLISTAKPETVFGEDIWRAIEIDLNGNNADIVIFSKCAEVIENVRGLAFASHEGDGIKFTLYFGRQPSLSRFNEICDFKKEDLVNLKSNFRNFLKSHYSLFQSNLTGLFIDVAYDSQISLVKPLSLLPSITDAKQSSFLEIDSILGSQTEESRLKLITDSDHHLLALEVGMNQMRIFYKGEIYLKWPGGDNYFWSKNHFGEWSDEINLTSLVEKVISFSTIDDDSEKKYVSNSIVKSVLKVSEEKGKGGMFIFGKSTGILLLDGYKSKLNSQQITFWKLRKITQCDTDDLFNMLIPDGATLVNLNSLIIENQIQVIPIEHGKAMDLSSLSSIGGSKGTKHMTGKAISQTQMNKLLVVCISADGPITVFYNGTELLHSNIDKITLIELKDEN